MDKLPYERPTIEIIRFASEDVITTSGIGLGLGLGDPNAWGDSIDFNTLPR